MGCRRQAIAGILLIGLLGTKLSEFCIKIRTFSGTKMHLNVSSAKWRPFCLGLYVLMNNVDGYHHQGNLSQKTLQNGQCCCY